MGFADTIKQRATAQAQKTLGVNKSSTKDGKTTGKTITQILTRGNSTTAADNELSSKNKTSSSTKKTRTSTKKKSTKTVETKETSIINAVKKANKSTAGEDRETRKKAIKKASSDAFNNKMDKLNKSFKKHAEQTIDGGVDMILKNATLQWATKTIGEAALLTTIMAIDAAGGDPLYNNGYCIKEFMKRDYSLIVEYLINKHNYSVCNGKTSKHFIATKYGATKCALMILKKKYKVKGQKWYKNNRYQELKRIILQCKTNFIARDILLVIDNGIVPSGPDTPIIDDKTGGRSYKRKILPSGYGDTGCDECNTRFKFTTANINKIFPEKRMASGIWVTYPKTIEHYKLFEMLMSKARYGDDRLQSALLEKRLHQNMVYTPLTKDAIEFADEVLRETGLDQVINAINNKDAALYIYVKWLVSEKYI